jgi:hypothetical protein
MGYPSGGEQVVNVNEILGSSGLEYRETSTGQIVVKVCPFCHDLNGKSDNLWKLYFNADNGLFLCHRCQTKGNIKQFTEMVGHSTEGAASQDRFKLVDQYLYQDESGCTCVRVSRLENGAGAKTFFQEHLEDGIWKKGGAKKPLQPFSYIEWGHETSIVIVEGEKCVTTLKKLGVAATTFIGGCNGWKTGYEKYFQNKQVVLLPDQDEPGFKFIGNVAKHIASVARSYQIILLPGLKEKEDICDWLKRGGTVDELKRLCQATPTNNLSCLQEEKTQGEAAKAWGELRNLPSIHTPVQDIPPDIIPEALRLWVTDIAERMQVPLVCVTVLALTVVGSLIGRKVRVYPKKEDDWYEVANLWSMIIMPSGRLKSPIIHAVLKPLQELSEQAEKEFAVSAKESELGAAVHEAKIQAAKKEIQKVASSRNSDAKLEKAQRDLMFLQENAAGCQPTAKRYKIHDATVEKIGELLKANTNGLLLIRDELSGWLSSLERIGREGDREFFLEAWNGKGSYDVDRITRGSIHIPALCLSILGGIPPSKIESYVESAVSGGAGNDGLLQRFGLMVHADFKKDWRLVDRAPNKPAYERVRQTFANLDSLEGQGADSLSFRFNQEAQQLFYSWLTRLEMSIRAEENDCDAFVSHISKYRKLVPALALQFFLLKRLEEPSLGESIDTESLTAAIEWARHLEMHARRVYSLALNPQIHAARALAQKIKQGKVEDGCKLRDIYRHQWTHLQSRAQVDMATAVLIQCNWVLVEEIRPASGAPCEVLRLNPALRNMPEMSVDRTDANISGSSVNLHFGLEAIA